MFREVTSRLSCHCNIRLLDLISSHHLPFCWQLLQAWLNTEVEVGCSNPNRSTGRLKWWLRGYVHKQEKLEFVIEFKTMGSAWRVDTWAFLPEVVTRDLETSALGSVHPAEGTTAWVSGVLSCSGSPVVRRLDRMDVAFSVLCIHCIAAQPS